MNKKLFTSGLFIVAGLLLGRITGFGREFLMAYKFGTTEFADVAVILFTIPDFLVGLLTVGGFSYALLPEFKRLPQARAEALYAQSSLLVGVSYSLITVFLIYCSSTLVYLLAPGITSELNIQASRLIELSLWVIPFSALTGITTAYLQSEERFVVTSLATPIFNTILLLGLLYVGQSYEEFRYLAYFILLAAFLRWVSQLSRIPLRSYKFKNIFAWEMPKSLFKNYFLITLSSYAVFIFPQILRFFGSFAGTGSLAKLSYTLKMSELPLGVFLTSLSILLFPKFAEHFKRDTQEVSDEGVKLLRNATKLITITGIACVMVMIVFAEDLTRWAYGWGKMEESALIEVAFLIALGLIGIAPQGISSLLICVYNAKADAKPLLYMNLVGIVFLCGGCFLSLPLGLTGILYVYILNSYFICALQLFYLAKRHNVIVIQKVFFKELLLSLAAMLTILLPVALSAALYDVGSLTRFILLMCFSPFVLAAGLIVVSDFRHYAFRLLKRSA